MTNLRIKQAADHLNVSTKTVRRLISAGDIPAIKVAACVRIDLADLDRYVAAQRYEREAKR